MSGFWKRFERETIGGYRLNSLLGGDETVAAFATTHEGRAAVMRFVGEESPRLERWRALRALPHPHLLPVWAEGRADLDGSPAEYIVTPLPDEILGHALESRKLGEEEAEAVLAAAAAVLGFLESRSLTLRRLTPNAVLAIDGAIVFDCLDVAPGRAVDASRELGIALAAMLPEPPPGRFAAAIKALREDGVDAGRALEALRAPEPEPEVQSQPEPAPIPIAAPEPVAAAPAPPPPKPLPEPRRRPALDAPEPRRASPPAVEPRPVVVELPARRPMEEPVVASRWWTRRLLLPAGAVVALIGILVLRDSGVPPAAASRVAPVPAAGPAVSGAPAPAANVPAPAAARPSPMPSANRRAAPAAGANWRVVAYTYGQQPAAEKRVSALREKRPQLQPEVFRPAGMKQYLVTLGGWMERSEAEQLLRRARAAGLPRDAYVRNFNR